MKKAYQYQNAVNLLLGTVNQNNVSMNETILMQAVYIAGKTATVVKQFHSYLGVIVIHVSVLTDVLPV